MTQKSTRQRPFFRALCEGIGAYLALSLVFLLMLSIYDASAQSDMRHFEALNFVAIVLGIIVAIRPDR